MDRRRSDGGVEECKGYSPPNDHTTSASSTPLSLDSWDLNAGTRSTETESFRSARVARRRATYAERTERQRLRDAHERTKNNVDKARKDAAALLLLWVIESAKRRRLGWRAEETPYEPETGQDAN